MSTPTTLATLTPVISIATGFLGVVIGLIVNSRLKAKEFKRQDDLIHRQRIYESASKLLPALAEVDKLYVDFLVETQRIASNMTFYIQMIRHDIEYKGEKIEDNTQYMKDVVKMYDGIGNSDDIKSFRGNIRKLITINFKHILLLMENSKFTDYEKWLDSSSKDMHQRWNVAYVDFVLCMTRTTPRVELAENDNEELLLADLISVNSDLIKYVNDCSLTLDYIDSAVTEITNSIKNEYNSLNTNR